MDIRGGVVIVTGSATGVGAACAKLLASKGCNVVINYTKSEADARETQAACEALGSRRCSSRRMSPTMRTAGGWRRQRSTAGGGLTG